MKAINEAKLEFWSRSANEGFARTTAACFAAQLDPTLDEINDIKTAVSEAVTNCIVHAYPEELGMVKLRLRLYEVGKKFQPPSAQHLLGTDNFGRDIFSRILDGAGTSFLIALCVVAIGCVAGILIGSLCGYYGGIPDLILTRVCDSITAFPSFLLALVIVSVIGGGRYNIILALGILFIPSFARVVRGEFARCRELNYVKSARLMGVRDFRILFAHILPNTIPVLLPAITIGFNNAILSEASMSFLGIGIQPPDASLGSMLSESQNFLRNAPWYALSTGLVIILLILGFSLLSEGLQHRQQKG